MSDEYKKLFGDGVVPNPIRMGDDGIVRLHCSNCHAPIEINGYPIKWIKATDRMPNSDRNVLMYDSLNIHEVKQKILEGGEAFDTWIDLRTDNDWGIVNTWWIEKPPLPQQPEPEGKSFRWRNIEDERPSEGVDLLLRVATRDGSLIHYTARYCVRASRIGVFKLVDGVRFADGRDYIWHKSTEWTYLPE